LLDDRDNRNGALHAAEILRSVADIERHQTETRKIAIETSRQHRRVENWRVFVTSVTPLVGTVVLAGTFALQTYQYTASDRDRQQVSARENRRLVAEQFDRAGTNLNNSASMVARLAGAYELGGIARTSREFHWPALRVLSAFVREQTNRQLGIDEQTALNILSTRDAQCEDGLGETLDLTGAMLVGRYLPSVNFHAFDLFDANLSYANMEGADLSDADVGGSRPPERQTNLVGTNLYCADLRNVTLSEAQVDGLINGNVASANIHGAHIVALPDNRTESGVLAMFVAELGAVDIQTEAEWQIVRSKCQVPGPRKAFLGVAHCTDNGR
jgi:uncharacterized protein YjbI with pentapeptide repeats